MQILNQHKNICFLAVVVSSSSCSWYIMHAWLQNQLKLAWCSFFQASLIIVTKVLNNGKYFCDGCYFRRFFVLAVVVWTSVFFRHCETIPWLILNLSAAAYYYFSMCNSSLKTFALKVAAWDLEWLAPSWFVFLFTVSMAWSTRRDKAFSTSCSANIRILRTRSGRSGWFCK